MRTGSKLIFFLFVASACVGCDQVAKTVAQTTFARESKTLLGGMLHFTYAENPGAFLSLGADLHPELRFWVFVVLAAVALVGALALALIYKADWLQLFAAALMVGGGCGNLIDRINLGVVRDFAQIHLWHVSTGIFNLADAVIMLGCVLLLIVPRANR